MERPRLIGTITASGNVTGVADRVRVTATVVAGELARVTARDRRILDLLDEHGTFTTEQLSDLAFGTLGRARNRLNLLFGRGVLDRFRHYRRPGSQQWRWVTGPVGAAIVAAGRGEALPRASVVRDAGARLAMSSRLDHLLAVNGFFVALTAYARAHGGSGLVRWWGEARCRDACANLVRPDGHGIWAAGRRRVPFWLEMDLGTEPVPRVAGKLAGYADLAGTRHAFPVLFWLPSAVREANLHTHLARVGIPAGVTVATATADTTNPADTADSGDSADSADSGGPAGAVWRLPDRPGRVRLADLPGGGP